MKLLYLCTYYHRAMIFRDSMDRLEKYGHEVKAFNAVVKGAKIDEKYKHIMDEKVIHKECFNKWDRFIFHLKQRKIYRAVIRYSQPSRYDLLHSHTLFNGGYVALLIKRSLGVPYVVSVRSTDMNVFLKIPFFKRIANKIVNNASGVVFISPSYKKKYLDTHVKNSLLNSTETKSIVVPNGVEDFWLKNKAEPKTLDNQKSINILCVGKIDKNKNITTTIKAIEKLIHKGYKVNFTVVGQVKDKSVLKEIKKSSFVNVLSYLTKEELIEVYNDSDIFVMPSITETFGRVYAEAMTQGLPVIYTKGEGFDGLFEDGTVGYAVPSNSPAYIEKCIMQILNNYEEISYNCVKSSDFFDWNNVTKKMEEFYKKTLMEESAK